MTIKNILSDVVQIQRKNIQVGLLNFSIKFINPIDKDESELKSQIENAPHLKDLLNLFDGKAHKKTIILCDDLNVGISTVGKIGKCMEGFMEIPSALESFIEFEDDDDDFFFEDQGSDFDNSVDVQRHFMESNFVLLSESDFDPSCDDSGETALSVASDFPGAKLDYSGFENIIFVCDGMFALKEKSIDFLQSFDGNVAIVLPNDKKNDTAIKQLSFESDFETFKVEDPSTDFLAAQFNDLALSKGFVIDEKIDIKATLHGLMKYRGNKFAEYDLSIYIDKAISLKTDKSNIIKRFPKLGKAKENITSQHLMDSIIGLEEIKETMFKTLYKSIHLDDMAKNGHTVLENYKHLAFEGNPGSCKTTMARAVARLYLEHNIVTNGFYEYGREDIVGRYLGETSQKVGKIFKLARGGVIFIDEIGALLTGSTGSSIDSYGEEALNAIVRNMENYPETMVIIATYPKEMEQIISVNPGLKSRLSDIVTFPDYSNENLVDIFKSFASKSGYVLEDGAEKIIASYFNIIRSDKNFGNGREARKLFESSVSHLAVELFKNKSKTINLLTLSAINDAVYVLSKNIKNTTSNKIGFVVKGRGE